MTKAKTKGQRRKLRKLSSRQIQSRDAAAQARTDPQRPADDPRAVVLSARCRILGRPDTKANRAALSDQMAGDPAGQAIIACEADPDARRRLWSAFLRLDTAHAAYHGRIIGQRRFPKTAKIEMMPERFETSASDPMDSRSPDERDAAAAAAWRAQLGVMSRLTVHQRMSLHDGIWLRGDLIAGGKPSAMGAAFVAALRVFADIASPG